MKVGILTRHHIYHHGAILQAYALQEILSNSSYQVEIIDYRSVSHERTNKIIAVQPISLIKNVSLFYYITRQVTLVGWSFLNIDRRIHKKRIYDAFISQFMRYSPTIYRSSEELNEATLYDAYIVGSDQIWKVNNEERGIEHPFFLPFVPKDKVRIAYAASFGKDVLPEKYEAELQELLTNFDTISIREKSSIPFIQKFTELPVVNVLDPALLMERKDWDEIVSNPIVPEKYLFVYSVTWNRNLAKFAKRVADATGLKMVCIGPDYTKLGLRDAVCGPDTFIGYIKNAAFVVTDSFHGTVFSIQYEKPFYSYPPKGEEIRISDILSLLGISDRLIASADDFIDTDEVIDYNSVNMILEKQRVFSHDFLQASLSLKKSDN